MSGTWYAHGLLPMNLRFVDQINQISEQPDKLGFLIMEILKQRDGVLLTDGKIGCIG